MSDIKKSIISLTQQEEQIATSSDEAVAIKELRDSYLAKSGFEVFPLIKRVCNSFSSWQLIVRELLH